MKLLEDHLRQLCSGPALGNLLPGHEHYFQPGVTLMVSVTAAVLLVFWKGAQRLGNRGVDAIHNDVNVFIGFIVSLVGSCRIRVCNAFIMAITSMVGR